MFTGKIKRSRIGRIICCWLLLWQTQAFGQDAAYQQLLDTAFSEVAFMVVRSQPLKKDDLRLIRTSDFTNRYQRCTGSSPDTNIFLQIIHNNALRDTTPWTERELATVIPVSGRAQKIRAKQVLQKLAVTDKEQLKSYKIKIKNYNKTAPANRNIYYVSKPVFDDRKRFAIMQFQNVYSGLGGGGEIALYERTGANWKKVCTLSEWTH